MYVENPPTYWNWEQNAVGPHPCSAESCGSWKRGQEVTLILLYTSQLLFSKGGLWRAPTQSQPCEMDKALDRKVVTGRHCIPQNQRPHSRTPLIYQKII